MRAAVIGRRSGGGRVLIWEVQKRKKTPRGLFCRTLSLSLSLNWNKLHCDKLAMRGQSARGSVHVPVWMSRRLCLCICICVCERVHMCVWRAAWRLPVCRRFIGEADEQGRYPGAAWQWPELYLNWNDFSTPFWSANPGAMSPHLPSSYILFSFLRSFSVTLSCSPSLLLLILFSLPSSLVSYLISG